MKNITFVLKRQKLHLFLSQFLAFCFAVECFVLGTTHYVQTPPGYF
jgi:hypothetical protein